MIYRSIAGVIVVPCLCGEVPVGMNRTLVSSYSIRTDSAITRCPMWIGSKVPPMMPIFCGRSPIVASPCPYGFFNARLIIPNSPGDSIHPHHSYRSASIGSSKAALRAGYRPKNRPIRTEKPNARRIVPTDTTVAQPKTEDMV